MNIAIGMVAPTVNSPHGLSASVFTTTSASTASRITIMARMASNAKNPAALFNSSFTICPSDLPSRRNEQNSTTKSCTAPAQHHPDQNPQRPGQIPELRRQHRPHQRPRPRYGREMLPEDNPLIRS